MKTNLIKILCILFLIVAIILLSYSFSKQKENFNNDISIRLKNTIGSNVVNEYHNHQGFQEEIDPNDPNNTINFNKIGSESAIVYKRKGVANNNDFTVGFYFKPQSNSINYNYLFSAEDKNENEVLRVDLTDEHIKIKYEGNELKIPKEIENLQESDSEYSYLVLKADLKNDEFIPKLSIVYNRKNYEMTLKNKEAQEITLAKFIFGNLKKEPAGFEGLIGKIIIMNEIIGEKKLCEIFNCNLNCFKPDGNEDYDGNVNNCIQDCMKSCADIQKCQKICVNCEIEEEYWDNETKLKMCPWLKNIKILDQTIPNAPKIRGYPGDGKILVEWKKPFDGRSEITNYIILYYESFNKKNGINVSISGKSDLDILEYQITNLKNKTYYDVEIRAVNSKGIGKPSNIISIAPNGNIVKNNNRNIFNELEDDLQKDVENTQMDFMCNIHNFDSVGHTLDYYDTDMTDIKNYIEEIKN